MAKHYVSLEIFSNYQLIFENIGKNETLKNELAEYGYDDAEIAKGKALYDQAQQKLDTNRTETNEERTAYEAFSTKFAELKKTYTTDRKKAKIIFKDQPTSLYILGVHGTMSLRITEILNSIDVFYKELNAREDLRQPLARLKITQEHITAQLGILEEVKYAYSNYNKEKGESQQATKDKEVAFGELEKWIKEFYAIAKIALEDKPQLLEIIGKFVRS